MRPAPVLCAPVAPIGTVGLTAEQRRIAQLAEHPVHTGKVTGSSPVASTKFVEFEPCEMPRSKTGIVHFQWRVSNRFLDPATGAVVPPAAVPIIHAAVPCVAHGHHLFLACNGERVVVNGSVRRHRASAPVTCKSCLHAYAANWRWV